MSALGSWSTILEEIHLFTPSQVRENRKGILPSFAYAADLRVQTASAMQASFNFKTRIVSADDTSYCQWMNGDFGISPFLGRSGNRCLLVFYICGAEPKAQGSVSYLVCGRGS